MLNTDDWKEILKVYKRHPNPAVSLALQFVSFKQALERGRKGIPEVIEGLEVAIDSLYEHTEFHRVGRKLYWQKLEDTITSKQEKRLRKLGAKI